MRRAGVPLLAICIGLALAACGGGDPEHGGSTTVADDGGATSAPATEVGDSSAAAGAEDRASAHRGNGGKGLPTAEAGSDDTAGAGPEPGTNAVATGVPVQPGGDNSVQVFGAEGAVKEREQAFSTLRAYLQAQAAGEWAKACAQTSEEFKEQLATIVRVSGKEKKNEPVGCTATLRVFLGSAPRSDMRRSSEVRELLSFRVEGGYAYVIFKGADGTVRFIAMADDDGKWKVNTTEPKELPPAG